jgi:hypothetical protein
LGFIFAVSSADAATITGTVKGPDGQPFRGAFVQARNAQLKMTVSVLTDKEGSYVVENLPAGDYRVGIRAVGYSAAAKSGSSSRPTRTCVAGLRARTGTVKWTDLSILQGIELLPNDRGKNVLVEDCMSCHGFQSKMAAVTRDLDGYRSRVEYMREAMRSSLADRRGFSDQQAEDIAYYMNKMFGYDSVLPKSPGRAAGLQEHGDRVLRRGAQDRLRRL